MDGQVPLAKPLPTMPAKRDRSDVDDSGAGSSAGEAPASWVNWGIAFGPLDFELTCSNTLRQAGFRSSMALSQSRAAFPLWSPSRWTQLVSVVSATSTGSAGRAEAQELRSQTWKHESAAASAGSGSADLQKPAESAAEPATLPGESSQASSPRGALKQVDYDLLHNLGDSLRSLDKQLGARSAPQDASTSDPAGHSASQIFFL